MPSTRSSPPSADPIPNRAALDAAGRRLAGVVHRTPVLTSRRLDDEVGAHLFLKAEHLQITGSFKIRGAYNAVAAIEPHRRSAGVVAYSSGNHAQAVARSAQIHGVPATIVMPLDAPPIKLAATRSYGATVITYDRYREDRASIAAGVAAERGGTLIPPFDHPDVIAGQSTVASELIEQVPGLDLLVVCVGGGGLISGCALACHHLSPATTVIGVEPATGNDVQQSLHTGRIVTIDVPDTIADGQQTTAPSALTFAVIQRHVHDIVTVTDEQIIDTMARVGSGMKQILEPSGASALAAVLHGEIDLAGARVGVTLSGGNVDLARYADLVGS